MKGPRVVAVAQKKLHAETLKTRKAKSKPKMEKASKIKDSNAPKRPPSAFLIFMEDFRKSFKENFPDHKSIAAHPNRNIRFLDRELSGEMRVNFASRESWQGEMEINV